MKRILVTGSNGVIGRSLVNTFLSQGCLVYGCDIEESLIDDRYYNHYKCDASLLPDIQVDEIYHLVGDPCPSKYLINPVGCISNVLISTYHILNMAIKNEAKVFIASSSEVYADTYDNMIENNTGNIDLLDPRSCYKESKRMVEVIATSYQNQFGVDIRIGRIFNTYGESNKGDTRAIPSFMESFRNNIPIILYGDGSQKRSFCYIDDTVKGILTLMDNDYSFPVNIGNKNELYSINEVLKIMSTIYNKPIPRIIPSEYPSMIGTLYRRPDTTLINDMGWVATTTLEKGLQLLIN